MLNIDLTHFAPYDSAFRSEVVLSDYAFSLCGGPCDGLFLVENAEMLKDIVRTCIQDEIPFRVLGGMTNVLVSDSGLDGIVLLNKKGDISHSIDENGSVLLKADSGVTMGSLVKYCILNGFSGLEWASGLPGTVGGAVYGNAGAFGSDIASVFEQGRCLDDSGSEIVMDRNEMGFGYRCSSLKKGRKLILLGAVFTLVQGEKTEIEAKAAEYLEKRKSTQPYNERSLGSVFKNPEGYSAGKLIQDAGMKGKSFGKAVVSVKHANFITTTKGVRSEDYRNLIAQIEKNVEEMYGIRLEPEIEMIGFQE